MKRRILALVVALALVALVVPAAVFSAEDTVSCTVSAALVSVTVTNGTVAYGELQLNTIKNTAQRDGTHNSHGMTTPQTQNITNTDNVAEDFAIKTSDAVGTTNWTLHATIPGTDEFTHAYNVRDTAYTGSEAITFIKWDAVDTYAEGVATDVAADGIKYLELEIGMPTSVTDAGSHTITVTVLATQHLT